MAKRAKIAKRRPRKLAKSRKKATAKKRTSRPRPRNPQQVVEEPTTLAGSLSTQIDIWTAYEQSRSVKGTCEITGYSRHVVSEVLNGDTQRQNVILDEFLEACVAEWETKQVRAHAVMNRLFELFEALMADIARAQRDKTLTEIKGRDGEPLAVMDAIELMVVSKLFDQAAKCAQVAHQISDNYRHGSGAVKVVEGEDGDNFENWSDRKLADALKAGGVKLPRVLELKMKRLESA